MSADERERPKGGLFYGWYIVGTVFTMQTVACGLIFYNLSFARAYVFIAAWKRNCRTGI